MSADRQQIHWFPGHMARARRQLEALMPAVDMIIEVRDARAPHASANPLLDELRKQKPKLLLLNKQDLTDATLLRAWQDQTQALGQPVLATDAAHRFDKALVAACLSLMAPVHARQRKRGIRPRAIRALIVGIPNVGKSTLINRLKGKRAVHVEDRPGVTRALKLVRINEQLEIVDSPGMLWPAFTDRDQAMRLVLIGSVRESGYPQQEVWSYLVNDLMVRRPQAFLDRYPQADLSDPQTLAQSLARYRGWLRQGEPETERVYQMMIQEMADGLYGPVFWDLEDLADGNT